MIELNIIFKQLNPQDGNLPKWAKEFALEVCIQVLELAAENAKLGYIRTLVDDPKEGDDAYKNFPIVDKESILNIINLIE